jgi:hypothetical protein
MPVAFDLDAQRRDLEGELGYRFDLAAEIDEARGVGGLASSAHAFLGSAVRSVLVDLREPAIELALKAKEWLEIAIEEKERPARYFRNGTESERHIDLAFCNWFLSGEDDVVNLESFVSYEDEYLADSPAGRDHVSVSLVLVSYLDARAYGRVIELVEATPGLSIPETVKSPTNEAAACYMIARAVLAEERPADDLMEGFSRKHVPKWLGSGHYLRFARWMKVLGALQMPGQAAPDLLVAGLGYCR